MDQILYTFRVFRYYELGLEKQLKALCKGGPMQKLDRFAKQGKVHPLQVFELVVQRVKGARSIPALLDPEITDDPELTGVRGVAIVLLFDGEVSDISMPKLAEMFRKNLAMIRALHGSITSKQQSDPKFAGFLRELKRTLIQPAPPAGGSGVQGKSSDSDARVADEPGHLRRERLLQAIEARRAAAIGNTGGAVMLRDRSADGGRQTTGRRYATVKSADRQVVMLEIIESAGPISPGNLLAELKRRGIDLSDQTIRLDMQALIAEQKGRVRASGSRQSRRYSIDGQTASGDADFAQPREAGSMRSADSAPDRTAERPVQLKPSAVKPGAGRAPRGAAMVPVASSGMESLVQVLTGQGGGDSALMQVTEAGRRAVRAFVRGAAGGVVQDVDALLDEDGPPDPERVDRARGGLLFLNLMLEGVVGAQGGAKTAKKR